MDEKQILEIVHFQINNLRGLILELVNYMDSEKKLENADSIDYISDQLMKLMRYIRKS